MVATDEAALICDLAETYGIYDYRQLPLKTVAVFSCGLRPGSRIRMKLADMKYSLEEILLAQVVDRLSILVWAKTKDGQRGINRPAKMIDIMFGQEKEKDISTFKSGEDFEKKRAEIIRGMN